MTCIFTPVLSFAGAQHIFCHRIWLIKTTAFLVRNNRDIDLSIINIIIIAWDFKIARYRQFLKIGKILGNTSRRKSDVAPEYDVMPQPVTVAFLPTYPSPSLCGKQTVATFGNVKSTGSSNFINATSKSVFAVSYLMCIFRALAPLSMCGWSSCFP